jgi:hypothetical protein
MPELLTNPAHWRLRAQEARRLAQKLEDPEAKAVQLKMADKYDRLAARATEWMNKKEGIPQFLRRPPTLAQSAVAAEEFDPDRWHKLLES